MFGRSKYMHLDTADDVEVEAFQAGELDDWMAFCGTKFTRGRFGNGGARTDAPICVPCALAAGWVWDPSTDDWYPLSEND